MADPVQATAARGQARRFLTFLMEDRLYALPAEEVTEVIRVPPVAKVPQGPASLLGVANLRGSVLPVASLRGLLGRAPGQVTFASRALVLAGAAPVALAVDAVQALVSIDAGQIETLQAQLAAHPGERLKGAFGGEGQAVVKILDVQGLIADAFVQRARPTRADRVAAAAAARDDAIADHGKLVTFEVAGQEYAMDLAKVGEIIAAPKDLASVPGGEALVLGVCDYRDTLLPLFSLRGLLGLASPAAASGREKVLVTRIAGVLVGLMADRMRAIIPADPKLIEPTPAVLAARAGGEARIKAIYRGEGGRRLISILAPDELFAEDIMTRLGQMGDDVRARDAEGDLTTDQALKFLVFRLGDDEFGLPIEVVDEVAQAPAQITRLPKTPKFLEGVINLRGEVLPVVDQRRRFDMPALETGRQRRLVVVRTQRHRAGLIVDSVSEVLSAQAEAIEAAPDLTGEAVRLVSGVINLQGAGRMVLVLDPAELLSRSERGLLDAFNVAAQQAT